MSKNDLNVKLQEVKSWSFNLFNRLGNLKSEVALDEYDFNKDDLVFIENVNKIINDTYNKIDVRTRNVQSLRLDKNHLEDMKKDINIEAKKNIKQIIMNGPKRSLKEYRPVN